MDQLKKFREIFWDAFHRPKLESQAFLSVWDTLEPINELVAGPLYAIFSNGNCNYIFEDKARFPHISDKDDFLDYCTGHIQTYFERVTETEAQSEVERKDKQLLLYQTDLKMELANLAYGILP